MLQLEIARGVFRMLVDESELIILGTHSPHYLTGNAADFNHLGCLPAGQDNIAVGLIQLDGVNMNIAKSRFGYILIGIRNRDMVPASPLKYHILLHIQLLNHGPGYIGGRVTTFYDFAHVDDL